MRNSAAIYADHTERSMEPRKEGEATRCPYEGDHCLCRYCLCIVDRSKSSHWADRGTRQPGLWFVLSIHVPTGHRCQHRLFGNERAATRILGSPSIELPSSGALSDARCSAFDDAPCDDVHSGETAMAR